MNDALIHVPQMLMIGSTGRNSGKTTLAVEAIQKWKALYPVIGLKVTSIEQTDGTCPRGGHGCGACSSLSGDFEIIEETDARSAKDTSQLLACGCPRVYWLKVLRTHMAQGILKFLEIAPPHTLIVCESNSLRRVVKPGAFIMLDNEQDGAVKDTARNVLAYADRVISRDIRGCAGEILEQFVIEEEDGTLHIRLV